MNIVLSNIRSLFFILLSCMVYTASNAQAGFEIWLNSSKDEYPRDMILNHEGDFIGIIWKSDTTNYFKESFIYKISQSGDTSSFKFAKTDTSLVLHKIITTNIAPAEYIISGIGYDVNQGPTAWFTYFAKIDEYYNIVWEKQYSLVNVNQYNTGEELQLLQLTNGNILHANCVPSYKYMYLFQLSGAGDSLKYRFYESDSAGETCDLIYNRDSSAYLLHTHFAHYISSGPESQCIELDLDLNQTNVMYYPRWFKWGMSSKLLPGGSIISSSRYFNPEYGNTADHIATYKMDNNFSVLAESFITDPDTNSQGGHIMLDFTYPDNLYVGGTHNHQVGTWVPGPSWIVIARMNDYLEVETEKYIGGDATYNFKTLTATPDSGVLISGTWYDYYSQSYERDVLLLKLNYEDFIATGVNDNNKVEIKSAIVYPNPGGEYLFLKTLLRHVSFQLFDQNGKSVLNTFVKQNITTIDVSFVPNGIYFWQISDQSGVIETGKWIKSK